LYLSPRPIKQFSSVKDAILNLQSRELIELREDQVLLTELGQAVCEAWQEQNMDDAHKIREAIKGFGKNQRLILSSLYLSPRPIKQFSSVKDAILNLQSRELIELREDQVLLTELGQAVCEAWQQQNSEKSDFLPETNNCQKKESPRLTQLRAKLEKSNQYSEKSDFLPETNNCQKKESPRLTQLRAKLEKSNQFLELYKQGLSYQDIGDKHGLTRERVRQILNVNPAFHEYVEEREAAAVAAEEEKKEHAKQELYSRSLAALYPERIAELWDYEKNGDLKPEDVPAGTVLQYVWFKCPMDGHSWKKKPNDITTSWTRNGTSGCPMCAGKKKRPEKQPALTEIYPELISQYWNYEKNNELILDPEKLTLASNKEVWFKCPHDGNEWQASIASTINQQWSKGNAGCRV
ncbi:MAG: hypothetical protein KGQ16_14680, partial [Cyanobacteria bacterium REEB444]|nr:hypothetical protein [Cyanobacteria bacterium REEB444]